MTPGTLSTMVVDWEPCTLGGPGSGWDDAAVLLVGEVLAHAARVAPRAVAATLDDDALTFGELDRLSNEIAHGLAGVGIEHGDRVLWWSDTALDALPVFGALAKLGAVFAPLNAR